DTSYAESFLMISDSLLGVNNAEEALTQATKAKDIFAKIHGNIHIHVATSWEQIGKVYDRLEQFDKAIESYETALKTYRESEGEQYYKIGEIYNDFGVLFTDNGEFKKGLTFHKKAVAFKEQFNSRNLKSLSSSYSNIGATYQYLSIVDSAIIFHNKSLDLRITEYGEESKYVADALNSLGSSYGQLGEHDKEIEYLLRALKIFEALVDETDGDRLRCYTNLGFSYKSAGNFSETLRYHHLCLDLHKKKSGDKSVGVAIAYNNLSTDYIEIGKFSLAKEYIGKAFKSLPDGFPEDHPHLGSFNNVLARCYGELGDYQRAIDIYEKGLNISIKKYGESHSRLLYAYHNLGSEYASNGAYEKAIEYFHKAAKAHLTSFDEIHPNVPYFYAGIGNAYMDLGEYSKAEEYHRKVFDIETAINSENFARIAEAYKNLAWVDFYKKNYAKSTEGFKKSIELSSSVFDETHPTLGYYYHSLALSLSMEEKYGETELAYQKSFKAYNYIKANDFESVNQIDGLISVLGSIGLYYQKKYKQLHDPKDLLQSDQYFQQALKAVDFKTTFISPDSKNNLAQKTKDIYTNTLSNTFLLQKSLERSSELNQQIFNLAERSKAYILLNAFQESKALNIAGIPENLLDQEFNLRVEIASLEKLKQSNKNSPDTVILNLSNSIADLKTESEFLKKQFENNYPDYFNAKYNQSILSLAIIQNDLLSSNQSLIEYVTGDSNSYILLINPDTFLIHEIPMDFPLNDWVEQLRDGLTKYHTTKGIPRSMLSRLTKDYILQGQQLYQKLITPIAPFLNEEVIIIPDGVLGYIPFEILLTEKPKDLTAFHTYPYFIEKHTISYCYSATLLLEMKNRKHRKMPSKASLSIAPFFKGDITAILAKVDTLDLIALRSDTLQALPFSGDEAAMVAKITSGDQWLGTEATLDNFTTQAPDYRILHLSTHGIADDKVGDYAYLAFGSREHKNEYEKLFIRDIYNIPLNADMVVLSACKTAYGKLQKGEGIISMARAFAYAGSKSIITSHWSVDDQSTGMIMEEFYKQLAKNASKDKALRTAKLKYMKDNKGLKAHPFFWAAFIGIGDMSGIQE
ncbi:MAG: CHAT domain-containing protein/Tfp pilus assembly protein PilF, partial [Saprospiraceae bacterium]